MRAIFWGLGGFAALSGAFLIFGFGGSLKSIDAGDVVIQGTQPALVSGSFTINQMTRRAAADPVISLGTGGACLIADLTPIGIPQPQQCQTDAQCVGPAKKAAGDLWGQSPNAWHAYCVKGGCWVRPGTQKELCRMQPKNPWETSVPHQVPEPGFDVKAIYERLRNAGKTFESLEWRVLACLNGQLVDPIFKKPIKISNAACRTGNGDHRKDYGTPSPVPG